ncbi:MAG: hybrid sensor histidine kinase/response regulator [Ignavibacteriae bacterium HGW-Ignavibacteriae-4]|jgi:signal transduction histidine kinase|nr:MAG: hybrid sensor histidine kinase/response regulator [Ignavibacteriae bacterium HGW-Ignavibacteriae-4]
MEKTTSILIVDDSSSNIDILVEILKEYQLFVALNGLKALEIAITNKPDIIILDVVMPEIDGFEVCKRLKENPLTEDIPVIFITAQNKIEDEIKGLELGAVDFISKPISPPIVLARVKNQLLLQESNRKIQSNFEELKRTQEQLIKNEKLIALGRLVASVAHEINTPIAAIKSSNQNQSIEVNNISENIDKIILEMEPVKISLFSSILKECISKTNNLTTKEERAIKRELSYEIGVAFPDIDSTIFAELLLESNIFSLNDNCKKMLEFKNPETTFKILSSIVSITNSINIIELSIEKVQNIVFSLKNYSRNDSNIFLNPVSSSIVESINSVLTLYNSKIKHSIELIKNYRFTETIVCYPDLLSQVWVNLLNNALQSMEYKGTLTITVTDDNKNVIVSIKDTGTGIPISIREEIFQPFFTTKDIGEGTGLGLDIVKKIIDQHKGTIELESEIGIGTTFIITLPKDLSN